MDIAVVYTKVCNKLSVCELLNTIHEYNIINNVFYKFIINMNNKVAPNFFGVFELRIDEIRQLKQYI